MSQNPLNYNYSKINNFRNKANNCNKNKKISNKGFNKRTFNIDKSLNSNNNSLLESFFELKNKEKSLSLNNYEIYNLNEKRNESRKNRKSFNNLNILNNFYNLEYSKRNTTNGNTKKKIL